MHSKKAFTLVELLVVVMILGALAAIAVPRMISGATNAKISACETNVDLVNSQIELYLCEQGRVAPAAHRHHGRPELLSRWRSAVSVWDELPVQHDDAPGRRAIPIESRIRTI